jgi:hypothetical protein
MRRFLVARELPAIFTGAVAGAVLALSNHQPAVGVWCIASAIWCALFWRLLATSLLPGHQPRPQSEGDEDGHHGQDQR